MATCTKDGSSPFRCRRTNISTRFVGTSSGTRYERILPLVQNVGVGAVCIAGNNGTAKESRCWRLGHCRGGGQGRARQRTAKRGGVGGAASLRATRQSVRRGSLVRPDRPPTGTGKRLRPQGRPKKAKTVPDLFFPAPRLPAQLRTYIRPLNDLRIKRLRRAARHPAPTSSQVASQGHSHTETDGDSRGGPNTVSSRCREDTERCQRDLEGVLKDSATGAVANGCQDSTWKSRQRSP